MAIENLVNLEKNAEMSPIKDEFLAGYSKQNSIECPILLVFVNSSQIFSEGLSAIAINKVESFSYT